MKIYDLNYGSECVKLLGITGVSLNMDWNKAHSPSWPVRYINGVEHGDWYVRVWNTKLCVSTEVFGGRTYETQEERYMMFDDVNIKR